MPAKPLCMLYHSKNNSNPIFSGLQDLADDLSNPSSGLRESIVNPAGLPQVPVRLFSEDSTSSILLQSPPQWMSVLKCSSFYSTFLLGEEQFSAINDAMDFERLLGSLDV